SLPWPAITYLPLASLTVVRSKPFIRIPPWYVARAKTFAPAIGLPSTSRTVPLTQVIVSLSGRAGWAQTTDCKRDADRAAMKNRNENAGRDIKRLRGRERGD